MKIKILSIAACMAVMMLASCGGEKPAATTEIPAEQAVVIDTEHQYVCPMNCENSASNEPGVCSVCGMDLVKNTNYVATSETTGQADSSTVPTDSTHENHDGHNH